MKFEKGTAIQSAKKGLRALLAVAYLSSIASKASAGESMEYKITPDMSYNDAAIESSTRATEILNKNLRTLLKNDKESINDLNLAFLYSAIRYIFAQIKSNDQYSVWSDNRKTAKECKHLFVLVEISPKKERVSSTDSGFICIDPGVEKLIMTYNFNTQKLKIDKQKPSTNIPTPQPRPKIK